MTNSESPMTADSTDRMDGFAAAEAATHAPEQGGGCTCGFCAYSTEHVVVYTNARRPKALAARPVPPGPAATRDGEAGDRG